MITVITPCYNGEIYIAETIRSVQDQTLIDWEYIIVDDGSTDRSRDIVEEIVRQDPRIRLVNRQNSGVAAARNEGFLHSNPASEYVIFLDHDDVWEPETLQELSSALNLSSELVAAYGIASYIGGPPAEYQPVDVEAWSRNRFGLRDRKVVLWPLHEPTTLEVLAYGNCIATPGQVLIRRSAFARAGLFDPNAIPVDDYDMWLRLSRYGPIVLVDRVVIRWRQHDSNASHNYARMIASDSFTRKKFIRSAENNERMRRIARDGWRASSISHARIKWQLACRVSRHSIFKGIMQSRYCARPLLRALSVSIGLY